MPVNKVSQTQKYILGGKTLLINFEIKDGRVSGTGAIVKIL